MWVARHNLNNSLVVFIHGFTGNPWGTWKEIIDRLQKGFPTEPLLRSYDLYLFRYDSGWWRQPRLRPNVVGGLENFLRENQERYGTVVLVGHSQGGLVAKLYVLDRLIGGHGLDLKVDLIITFGTPHHGIRLLNVLAWVPRLPAIGRRLPQQVFDLASASENMRLLKDRWNRPTISPDPIPPSANSRHIRSIAVVGAYDGVVGAGNAKGFPVDTPRYRPGGHPIGGSMSRAEEVVAIVESALRAHLEPKTILDDIERIRVSNQVREDYVRRNRDVVAAKVERQRPGVPEEEKEIKTASLLYDFLNDFPQRPMRAVDLDEALRIYVKRQLGDV